MSEPDLIFIVPYRDRRSHLEIFKNHMKVILSGLKYEILISHQHDKRLFNRGAVKNLGFIWVKKKYPNTYKNKTLIFHDIDYMIPNSKMVNWEANKGVIKHIIGVPLTQSLALGGIFSINAEDFENINGFPNIWTWGYEDNLIAVRAKRNNLKVDYSYFRTNQDKNIIILWHGISRIVNVEDNDKWFKRELVNKTKISGLKEIININHELKKIEDNIFILQNYNFNVPEKSVELVEIKQPPASFSKKSQKSKYSNVFMKMR